MKTALNLFMILPFLFVALPIILLSFLKGSTKTSSPPR
jgi:hypothetical protein